MNINSLKIGKAIAITLFLGAVNTVFAAPHKPADFRFSLYSRTTGELLWQRSMGGSFAIGYELTRNGESLGVLDALSYLDGDLEAGRSYQYTITAIDSSGGRSDTQNLAVNVPSSEFERVEDLQQQLDELQMQPSSSGDIPAPVAATGQTESVRFGDDGDFQSGVSVSGERFANNDNGTFTDNLTGITWLGVRECIVKNDWINAIDYANAMADDGTACSALRDGSGAGDWRLPTIKELLSLLDYSQDTPYFAQGIPYEGSWSENPWSIYWSSTSFSPSPLIRGWTMNPERGTTSHVGKEGSYYSWPVKR